MECKKYESLVLCLDNLFGPPAFTTSHIIGNPYECLIYDFVSHESYVVDKYCMSAMYECRVQYLSQHIMNVRQIMY